ncbi:hypothetical protein Poli38472_002519 [Pythium oligandrum]|uniref:Uncharacterized protein n=1 Tax=Pythium oligandrum TaxID=41045 RepID=A0A8K1CJI4_PYTOL|nr:hypothetical protein Poli38472_002519 [Pythium oligandrum]|eukprot:TMW63578.1 hypothetical protein Poli38472_002519 [Pythium oligandrum]
MSNESTYPQCLSLIRFHEMLQDGTLGAKEVQSLLMDRRIHGEYVALRQCDAAFQDMVALGAQKKRGGVHQHQHAAQNENIPEGMTPEEAKYITYVHCASTALCPSSVREWYACLEDVREGKRPVEDCKAVKSMLERCLRAETDHLFRASQGHVFRSSS